LNHHDQLLARVLDFLDRNREEAVRMSDRICDHPELGGEEVRTSGEFARALREGGFRVKTGILDLPTAFHATWGRGPVNVALLAEMDALPEIGHGCGHNLHGTASVFAALALKEALREEDATIHVFGTPAEETNGSKVEMARAGLFDEMDLALMFHCCSGGSYVDYRSMAIDSLEFTFSGRTAHAAAAPWEGRNGLNGVILLFHALDMLRQHVRPHVRMHGIITHGGAAPNIVPHEARAHWYFRAPTREELDQLVERVKAIAHGCAAATETEVSYRYNEASFDHMRPNPPAEEAMERILTELGFRLRKGPGPSGSSDVGNVSRRCPALQPELSISDREIPLHSREFALATKSEGGHRALIQGAKALAWMGLDVIFNPQLRERIRRAFESPTTHG